MLGALALAEAWFGFGSHACATRPEPVDLGALPIAAPDAVAFIALGDAGELTPHLERVTAAITSWCAAHPCDFGVLLGDNLYPRGPASADDPRMTAVMEPLHATGLAWYAALGNHDYGDSTMESRAANELAWARGRTDFVLPSPTYTFAAGPARFAVIDTTDIFWYGEGAQGAFLDELPEDRPVRVLLGHHPYRSDGKHGNAGAYEGVAGVPWLSGSVLERFYEQHACGRFALVLTGHEHLRERVDTCGSAFVISGAASKPTAAAGRGNTPAFVSGAAGFVWVQIRGADVSIAFVDEHGVQDG